MKNTVIQCLKVSNEKYSSSIAFPALGAGNLGYPAKVVAKVMINAVHNYFQTNRVSTCIKEVKFVIFMNETYEEFQSFLLKVSDASANTPIPIKFLSSIEESDVVPEGGISGIVSSGINPSGTSKDPFNVALPVKLCKGQLLSEKVIHL